MRVTVYANGVEVVNGPAGVGLEEPRQCCLLRFGDGEDGLRGVTAGEYVSLAAAMNAAITRYGMRASRWFPQDGGGWSSEDGRTVIKIIEEAPQ